MINLDNSITLNLQGHTVVDSDNKQLRACSSFQYKGYVITFSTVPAPHMIPVSVFKKKLLLDPVEPVQLVHQALTVEAAIWFCDEQHSEAITAAEKQAYAEGYQAAIDFVASGGA